MSKLHLTLACTAILTAPLVARPAGAAPRQIIVVVADGLSPETMSFGAGYARKLTQDDGATSALGDLAANAEKSAADGFSFDSLKGLLKTAAAHGYKTGLVTTDKVGADFATLYATTGADAVAKEVGFNFIAGGGRAEFSADSQLALKNAGITVLPDASSVEEFEGNPNGKTVMLQNDGPLSYAVDQNPENEAAFGEMVSVAMQNLAGENDSPYLLVVHDTLLPQALATKDSPAVAEELHSLEGIVGDIAGARGDNDELAGLLLASGGAVAPRFISDKADDRSNGYFMLTQMPLSFAAAGASLKGATDQQLTDFATDQYKGWKLTPETRAAIVAGTLAPEAALRASYEPALGIDYQPIMAHPMAYGLGLGATGAVASLQAIAGQAPPVAAPKM